MNGDKDSKGESGDDEEGEEDEEREVSDGSAAAVVENLGGFRVGGRWVVVNWGWVRFGEKGVAGGRRRVVETGRFGCGGGVFCAAHLVVDF